MNEVTIGEWTVRGLDSEGGALVTLRTIGFVVEVWVSPEGAGVLYSSYKEVPLPVLRAALDMGERMLYPAPPSCTTCVNYRAHQMWACPDEAETWAETWTDDQTATDPPPGTPMCPGYRRRDA